MSSRGLLEGGELIATVATMSEDPFAQFPLMEPPPKEFVELANEVAQHIGKSSSDTSYPMRAAMLKLAMIYADCHGLRLVKRKNRYCQLRKQWFAGAWPKPPPPYCSGYLVPDQDHADLFEGDSGFVFTSQPYGFIPEDALQFAQKWDLSVRISKEWSYWYPGKTILMEWRKNLRKA